MSEKLTVELPSFFAKSNKIQSHICEIVSAHSETPKSFDVTLLPIFDQRSACWRCGKPISNPHSIHWGVGPDCAELMGLPWKELPADRQDAVSKARVYLPKSFLSTSELILLRSWVNSQESEEVRVLQARLWLDDDRLVLESPYINKAFIDDLKNLPDRKWHADIKANSFESTPESLGEVLSVLQRWQVVINIDDSCNRLMNQYRNHQEVLKSAASSLGVETLDQIKYADIQIDDYDWGLKTTPWLHQAQAIMFVMTLFGKQVPKKQAE